MEPLVAHTGGLHDIAWFVVPVALALVVLRLAERRARQRAETEDEEPSADD